MTQRKLALLSSSIFAAMMMAACTPKKEAPKADAAAPATAAAPTAAVEAPMEIKFGTDATYAPFESTSPSGEIVGFDIDLAKAMCEEMKAKCTFANQAWDGIIPNLNTKKYDVIASSLDITPERKLEVRFTQKVWSAPSRFVAKTGSTLVTTPDGLKGKSIGVQQGTSQEKYVKKYFPDAKVKAYKTIEDSYNDLTAKRIDVVFADGVVLTEGFLKKPAGKDYAQLGDDIPAAADPAILGEGTGFAVRKDDVALADKLNKAFDAIRANGKYKTIADKYFNFDIYGK
ncbi:MAG: lysine/arginine/ornithine ABC transporter substrate-binding protein [Formosimonas sp.]